MLCILTYLCVMHIYIFTWTPNKRTAVLQESSSHFIQKECISHAPYSEHISVMGDIHTHTQQPTWPRYHWVDRYVLPFVISLSAHYVLLLPQAINDLMIDFPGTASFPLLSGTEYSGALWFTYCNSRQMLIDLIKAECWKQCFQSKSYCIDRVHSNILN